MKRETPLQKLPGVEAPIASLSAWSRAYQDAIMRGAAPSHDERVTQSPARQAAGAGA
ncbi:hypothetical protein [Paraburkholderia sp. PGU19]|uniref:hypothetical protein n=1 Tax=Paraburkholderia sp. PGU19 TaxID=2735434 RepID=UPI0015DABC6E|nr:hypothetical protein [Paraburkholderia sp. PGU19]